MVRVYVCIYYVDKLRPANDTSLRDPKGRFRDGRKPLYKARALDRAALLAWTDLWLALLVASFAPTFAQINANATIYGHVTDPSGAAFPMLPW